MCLTPESFISPPHQFPRWSYSTWVLRAITLVVGLVPSIPEGGHFRILWRGKRIVCSDSQYMAWELHASDEVVRWACVGVWIYTTTSWECRGLNRVLWLFIGRNTQASQDPTLLNGYLSLYYCHLTLPNILTDYRNPGFHLFGSFRPAASYRLMILWLYSLKAMIKTIENSSAQI